ncbi:hypothetical protein CDL12_25213 [Handroanthus impetiginosus]|uniref:Ninja-family protein n=1 Tax=Handroanthus impetiginosus TaxID=429701 RepID=A0A2G9GAQ5_9LAMI|nr:hypothetical protein CDL12_25213 [Handroanthus impetiginosus]
MEGAEENRGKSSLSLRMNGVSRDLLHKFKNQSHFPNENEQKKAEDEEEIELSLGLSMNGRFGVDPSRKKLRRSSSVSNLVFTGGSVDNESTQHACVAACESYAPLVRTCSLPTEAEEWRRVKELRCMEARKKRMNKLKNVRVKDRENSSEDAHSGNGLHEDVNGGFNVQSLDSGNVNGLENWNLISSPQVSVASRRSGSSGSSDLPGQLMEGPRQNPMTKSPSSSGLQCLQEKGVDRPAARATNGDANRDEEVLRNALLDMPYVSTRGYGPNHNKIEGFLYRYNKGDDVKIVCVCHGLFLSPAEFVKHGGGGDVAYPLKHIVVNPYPLY